ncbi:MAG: Tol-Pal system protein TolB [Sulfuricurvum sp.]
MLRIFFLVSMYILSAFSEPSIEVVKQVEALPTLAVEDASLQNSDAAERLGKMLVADMNVVSLFTVDDRYATNNYDTVTPNPIHKDIQYILLYRLSENDQGFKAEIKLLQNGLNVFEKSYLLKQAEMMVFLSHTVAYDINAKLGGTAMDWIKRKVLFVRLSSPRHSEIVAADYTLSYQKVVLSGGMYGFAKWGNREQTEFYYTSLSDYKPTIYKMSLMSGQREKLIGSDGMAVCSDVSEDGKRLLLTLAPEGQPDIFLYDTSTKGKVRLTDYSGIDVNGQFLGDNGIAFVSNRLGNPNIFYKKLNEPGVSQLVYGGKNNSSLSAYKNFLVYKAREATSFEGNTFNLHLISIESGNVRRLTASGINDFPRFSGDGEAVLFIKQEGYKSSLGVIRLAVNKSFEFPLKIGRIQSIDW